MAVLSKNAVDRRWTRKWTGSGMQGIYKHRVLFCQRSLWMLPYVLSFHFFFFYMFGNYFFLFLCFVIYIKVDCSVAF